MLLHHSSNIFNNSSNYGGISTKFTKRIFAALLTIALALSLSSSAFAAVDWDGFYIISQSPAEQTIPSGEKIVLSVEVNVPEGVEVEYRWHRRGRGETITTDSIFICSPGSFDYPKAGQFYNFYCDITAIEKNGDENATAPKRISCSFYITISPQTLWEKIKIFLGDVAEFIARPFALLAVAYAAITTFIVDFFKGLFK